MTWALMHSREEQYTADGWEEPSVARNSRVSEKERQNEQGRAWDLQSSNFPPHTLSEALGGHQRPHHSGKEAQVHPLLPHSNPGEGNLM